MLTACQSGQSKFFDSSFNQQKISSKIIDQPKAKVVRPDIIQKKLSITDHACNPYVPRSYPPELVIGPTDLERKILAKISTAKNEILIIMYHFESEYISKALIKAHKRGVKIRILFDHKQNMSNSTINQLKTAGIQTKISPERFSNTHAKVMWIDGIEVFIMSGNFNSYTMTSERNYGVFLRDINDVQDVKIIFEQDWNNRNNLNLPCTRLLVSPINARQRILDLINRAKKRLDLAVMYIYDKYILKAVKKKAAAGVKVRILLAHPSWIKKNQKIGKELAKNNIAVKFMKAFELHSKLVIADDVALIGSHNLSMTSIDKNREISVVVTHKDTIKYIKSQFLADWNIGVFE